MYWLHFLLALFALSICNCEVLTIDIGSSVKIALYNRTTKNYDIILNPESSRKSPCCIGIKETGVEIVYGSDAKSSVILCLLFYRHLNVIRQFFVILTCC